MVPVCVIGQTGDLRSIEQASVTSAASVTDSCRRSFSITWPIIRKRRRIQLDGGIYWCWPTKKWRLRKRNMEFLPMHQFLSLSVFILFPGNDNLSLFLHSHTFQYLFQATSILIIIPSLFFFLIILHIIVTVILLTGFRFSSLLFSVYLCTTFCSSLLSKPVKLLGFIFPLHVSWEFMLQIDY